MSEPAVPLVLSRITVATNCYQYGKTNLSHDVHVPYWLLNNAMLGDYCVALAVPKIFRGV